MDTCMPTKQARIGVIKNKYEQQFGAE